VKGEKRKWGVHNEKKRDSGFEQRKALLSAKHRDKKDVCGAYGGGERGAILLELEGKGGRGGGLLCVGGGGGRVEMYVGAGGDLNGKLNGGGGEGDGGVGLRGNTLRAL